MTSIKPYRLIAFDPGERTGFVLVRLSSDFHPATADPLNFSLERQGVWTVHEIMRGLPNLIKYADIVAYETWRLYESHKDEMVGNDMQPSQVVGMIRYEAAKQKKRIASNGADVKKPAVKNMPEWLRNHMALSSEQHDQDAIMHAWHVAATRWKNETGAL